MPEIKKPKMRIFAGPNGSGKSSLFEQFRIRYSTGCFINADNIETKLKSNGCLNLTDYNLHLNEEELAEFLKEPSAVSLLEKANHKGILIKLQIKDNKVSDVNGILNSYVAALIAMFIRKNIVKNRMNFSFETVMSHISKVSEIETTKKYGYKSYLYFICTDDPIVNISRVSNRVAKGGHEVLAEDVKNRYVKTLENLIPAMKAVDEFYIFDNSGEEIVMISRGNHSNFELLVDYQSLPNWFNDHVIKHIS